MVMHLPSPDLIDQRIRIQQCFYQTEASYGKQSQLLSAPAQSTLPILCLALSVSEPVFLACPLSLLLNQLGGSRFIQFYHFQLS